MPDGLGDEMALYDAAATAKEFVLVGDTGALGFKGVILRSTDGLSWQAVHDADIAPWSLSRVIPTGAGFLAIGGRFTDTQPDGSTGWTSAALTSPDGLDWSVRQLFKGVDILSVAADGAQIIATTDQSMILVSRDTGTTWTQVPASDAGFGTGSPSVVAVLANGRWVALGTAGASAAAWTSEDGLTWEAATIEAADPVPGIKSVTPGSIAVGGSGAVAVGTDDPEGCAEDDDFCGHYGAGWSTVDGTAWMRLPRGTPLTDGWGIGIWPAGSAGVVANLPTFSQSSNGWAWTEVPGNDPKMLITVLTRRGNTLVAAGMGASSDAPTLAVWVGSIAGR